MLAEAILVHGEIGYKFCWLLPSEDWIRRHQLGTNQLGHQISVKGIKVDRAKIDVIEKLPPPTNVKELEVFLVM